MSAVSRALRRAASASTGSSIDGWVRYSSLGVTPRMPLNLGGTGGAINLLYDMQMDDSEAVGPITLGVGAYMKPDPAMSNLRLVADSIITSGGRFDAGTLDAPFSGTNFQIDICGDMPTTNSTGGAIVRGPQYIVDTPTGNNGTTNDGGGLSRTIMTMNGGILNLVGNSAPIITKAFTSVAAGQPYVDVDGTVPMSMVGGTIMLTPDGFYDPTKRTESRQITGISYVAGGSRISVSNLTPFLFARFAQRQYATDNGLSLTPGAFTLRTISNPTGMMAVAGQSSLIDNCRAVAVIYKNNINIQGYDLAGHSNLSNGDGVHTMQAGLASRVVMKNLTLTNYGQRGRLGRYGIHVHIPSYNADGTPKNDGSTVGNLNSAFGGGTYHCNYGANEALYKGVIGLNGFNRFGVQHACRGVVFDSCIAKDSKGHSFFQETGAEEENTTNNCVAIGASYPADADALQTHENLGSTRGALSSFWFANHFNTHTNNMGVDTVGSPWINIMSFGILSANQTHQHGCFGFATAVPIAPAYSRNGTWTNNNGLCYATPAASRAGQATQDGNLNNDLYGVVGQKIFTTTDGIAPSGSMPDLSTLQQPPSNNTPMVIEAAHLHKGTAYQNVDSTPLYRFWQQTDQLTTMWTGTTSNGVPSSLFGPIIAYDSLNHENNYLRTANGGKGIFACGVTSYHGTLPTQYVTAYNFTGEIYTTGGANDGALQKICVLESWDNYLDGANDYTVNNPGWCLHNSDGYWQTPPAAITQNTTTYDALTGTAGPPGPKYANYDGSGVLHAWNLGVVFDPFGTMAQGPTSGPQRPNSWYIFNQPYYTYGLADTPHTIENNPQSVTTITPFMAAQITDPTDDAFPGGRRLSRTVCQRVDSSGNDVSGAVLDLPAFDVHSTSLVNHGIGCPIGGIMRVSWPTKAKPTAGLSFFVRWPSSYQFNQWAYNNPNQNESTAFVIWGVDWNASVSSVSIGGVGNTTATTSFALLQGKTSGAWHFNDTARQILWVRIPLMRDDYSIYLNP